MTQAWLDSKPKPDEYVDTKTDLRVIARQSGVMSWAVRYWFEKQQKLTIGNYPRVSCRFPLRFDPGFPLRTDPA